MLSCKDVRHQDRCRHSRRFGGVAEAERGGVPDQRHRRRSRRDWSERTYEDADGHTYHPLLIQPVIVLGAERGRHRRRSISARMTHGVRFSLYIEDMFATGHDAANREAVRRRTPADMNVVGLALREDKKLVDKITRERRFTRKPMRPAAVSSKSPAERADARGAAVALAAAGRQPRLFENLDRSHRARRRRDQGRDVLALREQGRALSRDPRPHSGALAAGRPRAGSARQTPTERLVQLFESYGELFRGSPDICLFLQQALLDQHNRKYSAQVAQVFAKTARFIAGIIDEGKSRRRDPPDGRFDDRRARDSGNAGRGQPAGVDRPGAAAEQAAVGGQGDDPGVPGALTPRRRDTKRRAPPPRAHREPVAGAAIAAAPPGGRDHRAIRAERRVVSRRPFRSRTTSD